MRTQFSLKLLLVVLIYLSLNFSLTSRVFASPIITEVHPHPQDGPEWVELYNPDKETADLTGWSLYDQLSSSTIIYEFNEVTLAPQTYQVFELSSAKLNNSADGVLLKDFEQNQVDAMQYESSTLGKSWSRKSLDSSVFIETEPTPGAVNPTPSPTPNPTPSSSPTPTPSSSEATTSANPDNYQITFSELYPCPLKNEPESVTLKNHANTTVNLTNWKIRDAQNNLRSLSGTLAPNATHQVSWQQSILNNTGDEVFLESNTGAVITTTSYNSCTKGESIQPDKPNSTTQTKQSHKQNANTPNTNNLNQDQSVTTNPTPTPPNYPLPNFSNKTASKTANNTTTTKQNSPTGQAIYTTSPTNHPSQKTFLGVILGGLSVSTSGALLFYEQKISNLFNHLG